MSNLIEIANEVLPYAGTGIMGLAIGTAGFMIANHVKQKKPEPGVFYQDNVTPEEIRRFKRIPTRYAVARIEGVGNSEERRDSMSISLQIEGSGSVSLDYSFEKFYALRTRLNYYMEDKRVLVHQWGSKAMAISTFPLN